MTPLSRLGAIGAALAVSALLSAGCGPAVAQVFAGTGAGVAMPEPQAPTAQVPALPDTVVRHLPGLPGGLRLTGEAGDLAWPLYLTAAEAAGARRLRIGYSSAISVLPEASRIAVRINDREIGSDLVEAPRGLRVIEFDIPPGLLQPGDNAVHLSVRQHHRVDCSVAATYELWTRIDPGQTGVVLASDAGGVASLDELPALRLRPDGSLPIHVMLQGKLKPSHVERLMAATSAIAIASRALQPVVDFDPSNLDDYGINLVVGPKAALARDPRLAAVSGMAEPGASIIAAGAHGRPTLVVMGGTEDEIDGAIATIARVAPERGSESGRLAARTYAGLATEGSESLRLRDLGLHSEEFSGRFVRQSFELKLPADFLAADYGRGTFDLAGAYAAGLAPGSQVRLDVNGKSSGVIKLPDGDGDVFRHNQLFVPLRLMRPGLNRFDIYAETPRPADESCAGDDTKRFLFSDLSRITLPTFARVERRPDLAGMTAGGLPFAGGPARLVVPKPDRATTAAALSIVARASVAAGKVIPFAFSTRMPSHAGGPTLVVSPAQALDPSLMAAIALDPSEIEAAWRPVAAQALPATQAEGRWWLASNDGPAACRVPAVAQRIAPAAVQAAPRPQVGPEHVASAGDEDLLETWSEQRDHDGWLDAVEGYAGRVRAWVGDMRQTLSTRLAAPTRVSRISSDASIILAQGVDGGSPGAVTTIVTAPSSDILSAALPCLLDPQVWSGVHGRLAEVDASRGTVTAVDATSFRYVRGSQTSLGNARLVLAGWFSLDPLAFVAIAMLLALSLSGTTLWFVRGVGRTSE